MNIVRIQIVPSDHPTFYPTLVIDAIDSAGVEHCLGMTISLPRTPTEFAAAVAKLVGELEKRTPTRKGVTTMACKSKKGAKKGCK